MPSRTSSELSCGVVVYDYKDDFRCCGIRHKQWILTSGLILCSYISPDDMKLSDPCWNSNNGLDNDCSLTSSNFMSALKRKLSKKKFKVLVNDNNKFRRTVDDKKTSVSLMDLNSNYNQELLTSYVAYPSTVFRSSLVSQYVVENFSDWQLCTSQEQFDHVSPDVIQNLLSIFVILRIDDLNEDVKSINEEILLNYFLKLCKCGQNYYRGLNIVVESSPFAVPQFYNSWSKGIISNNIGSSDCLFFTDTRLVIGCVGAPVYRFKQGYKDGLVGMIINPMLWSQGEWAGFSVGVNLQIILTEALNQKQKILRNFFPKEFFIPKNLCDDLDKAVVLVRCGHSWGSGVIVNKKSGIIVTCAHVVNYGEDKLVSIVCGNYQTKAEIIYASKLGEVFDIAALKTEPLHDLKELPLVYNRPVKGETVFCVGFPMVDTKRVTMSKGVIANVVPDVFIQTTCCVQSGASGGAIINTSGGLLGVPVSNMRCASTRALFPHCNLAVPTTSFATTLTQYLNTNDKSCLANLTSKNPIAIKEWALQQKCKM